MNRIINLKMLCAYVNIWRIEIFYIRYTFYYAIAPICFEEKNNIIYENKS